MTARDRLAEALNAATRAMDAAIAVAKELGQLQTRDALIGVRESGAIEQDADTVLFVHREELHNPKTEDKGIAEIIIGKQRSGPTGTIRLRWVRELTRFESLHPSERQAQGQFDYGSNGARNGHAGNGHSQPGRDGA